MSTLIPQCEFCLSTFVYSCEKEGMGKGGEGKREAEARMKGAV